MSAAYLCGPRVYEFEGILFEISPMIGPWPLKKNCDPKSRAGKKFREFYRRFSSLPQNEQEKHRIGGGCITIKT